MAAWRSSVDFGAHTVVGYCSTLTRGEFGRVRVRVSVRTCDGTVVALATVNVLLAMGVIVAVCVCVCVCVHLSVHLSVLVW